MKLRARWKRRRSHLFLSWLSILWVLCTATGARSGLKAQMAESVCNTSHPEQRVLLQYSTSVVRNEYIITFKHYYRTNARDKFIKAALKGSGIHNWERLPRQNAASDYPSDFELIRLPMKSRAGALLVGTHHVHSRDETALRGTVPLHMNLSVLRNAS